MWGACLPFLQSGQRIDYKFSASLAFLTRPVSRKREGREDEREGGLELLFLYIFLYIFFIFISQSLPTGPFVHKSSEQALIQKTT